MSGKLIVRREGAIAEVLLNRPEALNVFDFEMTADFASCFTELAADPEVRGVVLSGQGKAFSAGGDLKCFTGSEKGASAAIHDVAGRFHQAVVEIRRMSKPVIAAVNGVAAGGGFSLALACDFRVMAESAVLRQAYTSAGLCLDGGGSFTLPRLVGLARAMEITAFDRPISSGQALEWGLVTKVVKDGAALEEAKAMAAILAKGSLHSFGLAKQLFTDSFTTSFETQLERERAGISACAAHSDGREGLRAFVEKRKPIFHEG